MNILILKSLNFSSFFFSSLHITGNLFQSFDFQENLIEPILSIHLALIEFLHSTETSIPFDTRAVNPVTGF